MLREGTSAEFDFANLTLFRETKFCETRKNKASLQKLTFWSFLEGENIPIREIKFCEICLFLLSQKSNSAKISSVKEISNLCQQSSLL